MHYLYILHSESLNTYYVGESPDPTHRLNQHNTHYFKKNFTKATDDWVLKLKFETTSKEDAVYLEKFAKRMRSRIFNEKLIASPAILVDILKKK